MADQDLGLHYRLSIIKRDGELVLVGISNRNRNAPTIEIGRTNGTKSG
jgi:N-acetylmuramoyl-L-alanine amidase